MRGPAALSVFLALGIGCTGTNSGTRSPSGEDGAGREPPREATASTWTPVPMPTTQAAPPSGTLAGTAWRAPASGAAPPSGSTPTLTFDSDQHAAGSTGCNRFSGTVAMDGPALRFGLLLTTRRGCPEPVMELEKRFLHALEACRAWRRSAEAGGGETLELLDESGAVVLRLEKAPG
jgi:heat shock protein HslJ